MATDHFRWLFTFKTDPLIELTLEENDPNLPFIKDNPSAELISANLVDTYKFSAFDDSDTQLDSVVYSIQLPSSKLERVFRRVEINVLTGEKIRIPAFQYSTGTKQNYCFACPDKVVLTDDPKFTYVGLKEYD